MAIDKARMAQWANDLTQQAEWKELMVLLKQEFFAEWVNHARTAEQREETHRQMLALGRIENRVTSLKDDHVVAKRKAN